MYGQRNDERDRRIDETLDLVDLADERDVPVGDCSGGMKGRLEIGRGLLHEPTYSFWTNPRWVSTRGRTGIPGSTFRK